MPDVDRNRSIEAHLANHGIDLFYGQGTPRTTRRAPSTPSTTRLRVLRVDRTDGPPLAGVDGVPGPPDHLDAGRRPLGQRARRRRRAPPRGARRRDGFVGLYANGASGDLLPRFDAWNPQALMDLHGRRIAAEARTRVARGRRAPRRADLPVDVRWTRACYCGQEVEPGKGRATSRSSACPSSAARRTARRSSTSRLATEGRRLPAEAADPVHGRKIPAAPRAARCTSACPRCRCSGSATGCCSPRPASRASRWAAASRPRSRPLLPAGVAEPFVVGLANDYMGYLTTPEEYELQHYEGGHTVYGT